MRRILLTALFALSATVPGFGADRLIALPQQGLARILGGTCAAHQFVDAVSISGLLTCAQPSAGDLALTSAHVIVGNASNVGADVAMSGVIAVNNTGATTFAAGTTGSGVVVLATSPTLVTPNVGVATGTSLNTTGTISQNGAPIGVMQCGVLKSANMNSTADQAISILLPSGVTSYRIQRIDVVNPSTSLTTAQGGIYSQPSKAGNAFTTGTPATFSYATLTTNSPNTSGNDLNMGVNGFSWNVTTAYLSLTTAQGSAATADFYITCQPFY